MEMVVPVLLQRQLQVAGHYLQHLEPLMELVVFVETRQVSYILLYQCQGQLLINGYFRQEQQVHQLLILSLYHSDRHMQVVSFVLHQSMFAERVRRVA